MIRVIRAIRGKAVAVAVAVAMLAAAMAPAQTPDQLYVCIQDEAKIAVLDIATRSVVRTIDLTKLGFPATAKPHYIVVEPDGANWYVSLIGANRVLKFDRADRVVGQFEMEVPGMMSLAPGGEALLVSRSMSAVNPPPRIAVVRRSTMQGDELDVLFPRPHPVAVAPNGYGYTGSLGVNQIASVSLADDRVEIVPVAGPAHSFVQFAISPDGRTLVGSTDVSGRLLVFDLAAPDKPRQVASVDVGKMAFDPVFTRDGRQLWVPVKSTGEVVVVETGGVDGRRADPRSVVPAAAPDRLLGRRVDRLRDEQQQGRSHGRSGARRARDAGGGGHRRRGRAVGDRCADEAGGEDDPAREEPHGHGDACGAVSPARVAGVSPRSRRWSPRS